MSDLLRRVLRAVLAYLACREPCDSVPVVWSGNWDYRCEFGHQHKSERGAIGGDFPL